MDDARRRGARRCDQGSRRGRARCAGPSICEAALRPHDRIAGGLAHADAARLLRTAPAALPLRGQRSRAFQGDRRARDEGAHGGGADTRRRWRSASNAAGARARTGGARGGRLPLSDGARRSAGFRRDVRGVPGRGRLRRGPEGRPRPRAGRHDGPRRSRNARRRHRAKAPADLGAGARRRISQRSGLSPDRSRAVDATSETETRIEALLERFLHAEERSTGVGGPREASGRITTKQLRRDASDLESRSSRASRRASKRCATSGAPPARWSAAKRCLGSRGERSPLSPGPRPSAASSISPTRRRAR